MDLDRIVEQSAVLVGPGPDGGFTHWATAWTVGPGEWVTAWSQSDPPPAGTRLLRVRDGALGPVDAWEHDRGIAGFRSLDAGPGLPPAHDAGAALRKRARLVAVGFPTVIDHPAFRLHRGSLDAERYVPYLCPWVIDGHLALFTADDGFLTGRCYAGMAGGPVLNQRDEVVGLLLADDAPPGDPPLARFRRVD